MNTTIHARPAQSTGTPRQGKAYSHRWLIHYTATALTPLSIGDGRTSGGRVRDRDDPDLARQHNTVARDAANRPYLVASGIKGALRAWANQLQPRNPQLDVAALFGADNNQAPATERRPGYVDLHDAHLSDDPLTAEQRGRLAHATQDGPSYIDTHTHIDRDTLTVADRLLFNQERVAPATAFQGSFLIQHPDELIGKALAAQLVGLLNAATTAGGLALGGDTGRGMGRVAIRKATVHYFGPKQFTAWLEKGCPGTWRDGATELKDFAAKPLDVTPTSELTANIQFTGLFLVNEPSRATAGQGENSLSQTARLDKDGAPVLPASTLHGALRAQAERIMRTLGLDPGGAAGQPFNPASPGGKLVAALFGHIDQAAALEQPAPPVCTAPGAVHRQDFIAIDRFTGGGKDGAKYKAESRFQPAFKARLRLRSSAPPLCDAARGLLLLTLRDLAEGDITLGWGQRKGYGACTATGPTNNQALVDAAIAWLGGTKEAADTWLRALRGLHPDAAGLASPPGDTLGAALGLINATAGRAGAAGANPQGGQRVGALPRTDDARNDHFHNSYHFVPLPQGTALPGWVERDMLKDKQRLGHHSHARYASQPQGADTCRPAVFSGRLVCTLTSETPFIVGGRREQNPDGSTTVFPYQLPDGQLAIPASSLKGLISNIAEAASGSAMRVLDDTHVISYRMRAEDAHKNLGYLHQDGQIWKVFPLASSARQGNQLILRCKATYASRTKLSDRLGNNAGRSFRLLDQDIDLSLGKRDLPEDKNGIRLRQHEILLDDTAIGKQIHTPEGSLCLPESVVRQFNQLADECTKAHLGKKATDDPLSGALSEQAEWTALPYHLLKATRDRTSASPMFEFEFGARNSNPKPKNRFEQEQLRIKAGDIVYFTKDNGGITAIAYSQIWRSLVKMGATPANYSHFLPNPELRPLGPGRSKLSPAELMFGVVEILPKPIQPVDDGARAPATRNTQRPQALAFAGKLRFADALPTGQVMAAGAPTPLKLLANPKPPSPALYFKPRVAATGEGQYIAKRELNPARHQINGRKTYLHALGVAQGQVETLNRNGYRATNQDARPPWVTNHPDQHQQQRTWAHLVPSQSGWSFHIDFDNLSRNELALLVYSLRPSASFRHKLGLGKAIGLGSVAINPQSLHLIDRQQRYRTQGLNGPRHTDCLDATALQSLASVYRESQEGDPAARAAQALLGDPHKVRFPVHVPQVSGSDIEKETFHWFCENDRESKQPIQRQSLGILNAAPDAQELPSLQRRPKTR